MSNTVAVDPRVDKTEPVQARSELPPGAVAIQVGAYVVLIDEADLELVSGHIWRIHRHKRNRKFYAVSGVAGKCGGIISMHRLIAGTPEGLETDHKNRDGLDNRRSNLRWATKSQNGANSAKRLEYAGKPTSSRFKGVSRAGTKGRWQAMIRVDGRNRYLGSFDDEIEAARAYNVAALAQWGEFARLNELPDEVAS